MEITWHGHDCFTLKGDDATIVIDPYEGLGASLPSFKADIVTLGDVLAEKTGSVAEVAGEPKVLDWPGEFEVSNVAVEGFSANRFMNDENAEGENANVFIFVLDGIKVCHMSGLSHEVTDELLDKIGDVDVLLIPVGGQDVLDGKTAHKLVESIEPRLVVPMYYAATETKLKLGGAEEFLKLLGKTELDAEAKLVLKGRSSLSEGAMQVAVLEPQTA